MIMARPKTFAPPVAFRLEPEYHAKLNARAVRSGEPLAVYVREQMKGLLDRMDVADKRKAAKTAADAESPNGEKTPAKPAPRGRGRART